MYTGDRQTFEGFFTLELGGIACKYKEEQEVTMSVMT
jgi:hypothetical protein